MQTSQRELTPPEARNKAVVLAYYDLLCGQWDFDAARQHIGGYFRQHNPAIADGIDGLRAWVENRPPITHHLKASLKRILVDGDLVMLHTVVSADLPDVPPMAIADIFRLEEGKVVEHWDVIQPVPAEALHDNGIA